MKKLHVVALGSLVIAAVMLLFAACEPEGIVVPEIITAIAGDDGEVTLIIILPKEITGYEVQVTPTPKAGLAKGGKQSMKFAGMVRHRDMKLEDLARLAGIKSEDIIKGGKQKFVDAIKKKDQEKFLTIIKLAAAAAEKQSSGYPISPEAFLKKGEEVLKKGIVAAVLVNGKKFVSLTAVTITGLSPGTKYTFTVT